MILLEDDDSSFREIALGLGEELDCIFVVKLGKDPLNPDAVVLSGKLELLQPLGPVVGDILVLQNLPGLLDELGTLVNYIDLDRELDTVLKAWQRSSLEILPMPAPQSRTLSRLKMGLFLRRERMKPSENLISMLLRCPYPPSTPL